MDIEEQIKEFAQKLHELCKEYKVSFYAVGLAFDGDHEEVKIPIGNFGNSFEGNEIMSITVSNYSTSIKWNKINSVLIKNKEN